MHAVSARNRGRPLQMRLGFWLAITPIIMLPMRRRTKSSRTTWMAREQEPEERWLLGSPAAGNPPFVICLRDPSPHPANGVDSTLPSFRTHIHTHTKKRNHFVANCMISKILHFLTYLFFELIV